MADAQASGACGSNTVWVQVPSSALIYKEMAQTLSGSFLYRAVQTSPLKPVASRSRLPHIRKEDQIERFGPFFLCVNIVSEELTVQVITKRKLQAEQK